MVPHRDSIPDLPACSSVAIPTELPGSPQYKCKCEIVKGKVNNKVRIVHENCVNTYTNMSYICCWPVKNLAELAYGPAVSVRWHCQSICFVLSAARLSPSPAFGFPPETSAAKNQQMSCLVRNRGSLRNTCVENTEVLHAFMKVCEYYIVLRFFFVHISFTVF